RLKDSLVAAGTVFAATTRALAYRVSRSMTSSAMSRVMASAFIASIVPPFSGSTVPEQPEERGVRRFDVASHTPSLRAAGDRPLTVKPLAPGQLVTGSRQRGSVGAGYRLKRCDLDRSQLCDCRAVGLLQSARVAWPRGEHHRLHLQIRCACG